MLCDVKLRKFFESMMEKNIYNLPDVNKAVAEALSYISEETHMGKLEISLVTPSSTFELGGNNIHDEYIISKDGYNSEQVVIRECKTGDNGHFKICIYPDKYTTWNEEETEEIYFLCGNIIIFGGRTRLNSLALKSINYDSLTGITNTNGLANFVVPLSKKGEIQNYTGAFINIKNFKIVNKRAGNKVGDICLFQFGQMINRLVGEDGNASRLGGDNFFVILKNEKFNNFANEMKNFIISCTLDGKEYEFELSARMGVYECKPGDSMGELMNNANIAYSISKNGVNDVVVFRQEMQEYTYKVKEISMRFPKALEKEEFVVYYQPKIDLKTDTLCGGEALVRWIRDGRLVPPMDFVPVLEQEGTICLLDIYVLEHVCKDIRKWIDSGIEPVRISVNFSKQHLHNKMLANRIISIIDKYKIDGKYIEIEITEMSGYEDYSVLSEFINTMSAEGIATSIDDFGTGYSSINLIKDLNVDIIKLDKSLLYDGYDRNNKESILLRNIISMINELGMQSIAEGVETEEQVDYLKSINCSMVQGFFYDRPMSKDEYEKRLLNKSVFRKNNK